MSDKMEAKQESAWLEAQNIVISEDLCATAKQQLQFLAAVDRNRCLYEGPVLQRAIYRYNECWLPLLATHSESQIFEGPLVVPLDCEWVWHCHRLNPVQYKFDCEKIYGRILDNYNVVSSVQGISEGQTKEIWNKLYPEEPYDCDLTRIFSDDISQKYSAGEKFTKYDLVAAVERQSPFFYQVFRPHMNNDLFLEGAVARYKGFLHLIKINRENSVKRFCVPTYDIDLIWHSHQLHPVSYCEDMSKLLGKILEHDDMDADRTKGKKLDVGFSETTQQWEETFGSRYWRAGGMYRGSAPAPLTITPCIPNISGNKVVSSKESQKIVQLPKVKFVEVYLEIVGVRNLPEGHKGSLFVSFSKKQPDIFFNAKRRLTILSKSAEKQVASFQCEPTGDLIFELTSYSLSNLPTSKPSKALGSTSLSLQDLLSPHAKLSFEKWLELTPSSSNMSSNPIFLRIAVSVTVPALAPHMLHLVLSRPFSKSSCLLPLPGRTRHAKSWTHVIDETDTEVISLQLRDSNMAEAKAKDNSISSKEVIGMTKSGESYTLAESVGNGWSLMDSSWSLQRQQKFIDGHLFELTGNRMVKIFPGRKLEYEPRQCEKQGNEHNFMTAVEFSPKDPYGKAVALLDLKYGFLKVNEEWFVLPGITLAFIFSNVLKKEEYNGFLMGGENLKGAENSVSEVNNYCEESKRTNLNSIIGWKIESRAEWASGNAVIPGKRSCSEDYDGVYDSMCESAVKSGGCGSGCGSGCENMVKNDCFGGCGSGCGSGCGNMVKNNGFGGCGSGCGGGCGSMVKSGGCGGGCGSGCAGCGAMVKSSGCGGCGGCGGSCGGKSAYDSPFH